MNNGIKNILIIDDDADICEVTKIMLMNAGYTAKSMTHFEPFHKKDSPDVILLDIALPGQDGRKICKQLKSDKATSHIPIIMFSASSHTRKAAFEAGADDSIEKPFQLNELVEKIKKLHRMPQNGEKIPQRA